MNAHSTQLLNEYLSRRSPLNNRYHWTNQQIDSHQRSHKPWLATTEEGKIIALVLYNALPQLIDIHYLETNPIYIRQGCMEKLFAELQVRHPDSVIWLEVHESNSPARNLYGKLGFTQKGVRKNYYSDGSHSLQLARECGK